MTNSNQSKLNKYWTTDPDCSKKTSTGKDDSPAPDAYQFEVTRYRDGRRYVVSSKVKPDRGWIVGNREHTVKSIKNHLVDGASSVRHSGGPFPNADNVTVTISEEIEFDVDAAEVIPEREEIESNFII